MKPLAALTAGALALVLVALYLGDTSGSSTATTDVGPTDTPQMRPKQEAIDLVAEHVSEDFGDNHVEITAEHMLAHEAYVISRDMGIGELNIFADTDPTCPPDAFGCGAGSVSESAPGYLVLVTGVPISGVDPAIPPQGVRPAIQATWISDGGRYVGIGIAYPSPTPEANGSLLIRRADWALRSTPAGNSLSIVVAVGGGCQQFDRIATSEDDKTVTIHAYVRDSIPPTPPPYWACTAEMKLLTVAVQLDKPLGDRKLQGCASGQQYPYFESTRDPVNCPTVSPY